MGLDDLVPEGKEDSRSRSGSSSSKSKSKVSFGSGKWEKIFSEDKWEDVKNTLINDMGLVPNEVVNNYPKEERYETLHEAALISEREEPPDNIEEGPDRCAVCGNALHEDITVEIEGEEVCANHPAAQIRVGLDEN